MRCYGFQLDYKLRISQHLVKCNLYQFKFAKAMMWMVMKRRIILCLQMVFFVCALRVAWHEMVLIWYFERNLNRMRFEINNFKSLWWKYDRGLFFLIEFRFRWIWKKKLISFGSAKREQRWKWWQNVLFMIDVQFDSLG